jgi:2-amino-4-hydroxy-6-hydroxymethyldihydropteridine diphosphokinase
MPTVYVSIGSNIEKEENIRRGVHELAAHYAPLTLSKVYKSRAIGFNGDDFYNLVAAFDTRDTLEQVSAVLAAIEQHAGRVRNGVRFGPRTLDMDIVLYGDLVYHDATHHLPRSEIDDYACVLQPLAEIAPGERHPETGVTYRDMWRGLASKSEPLRVVDLALDDEAAAG